jgi:hypothetical protein
MLQRVCIGMHAVLEILYTLQQLGTEEPLGPPVYFSRLLVLTSPTFHGSITPWTRTLGHITLINDVRLGAKASPRPWCSVCFRRA